MPALPIAEPEKIGLDPKRLDDAYKLLEAWTAGPEAPIPGGALAVGRHGKLAPVRRFGKQGAEADAPAMRDDSLFLLASITKPFTYAAGLMMVERGLLSLTDKVTRHLPEFAAHHKEDTLVLHLFTHTSGLPDMLPNNIELRQANAPLEKFVQGAMRDTVPLFAAGTKLSYQSMGTLLVAELVQRLSGMTISDFIQREILDPLGMKSTGLGLRQLEAERVARLKVPEQYNNSSYSWNSPYWRQLGAPWGGMFASPEDLAIFCQTMLNYGSLGEARLLSKETTRLMTTNRLHDLPELPEATRRCEPWGLGWKLTERAGPDGWADLLDAGAFGHIGATGTLAWVDRSRDGFAVILTTAPYELHPWRIGRLSSALAAAFV